MLNFRKVSELKGKSAHSGPVFTVRFTKDGTYCLSGGQDRIVRLWNPHKGLLIKQYAGAHGYEIRDIAVHNDNGKFASCGGDRTVFFWDVSTGKTLRRIRGHDGVINSMAFNADCTVLMTGSYDKTVRAWDLKSFSRDPIQVMGQFKDSVSSVAVSGHEIIVGSIDGCVRTYDLRMGKLMTDNMQSPITSVEVSNDANCVLLSCLDSKLRLLDKVNGDVLNTYSGHTHAQYSLKSCFSFDDAWVISGSEDRQIVFWDLVEAKCIHSISGHSSVVTCVKYHPTEHKLLSADEDGVINLWQLC
eukprot:84404_1